MPDDRLFTFTEISLAAARRKARLEDADGEGRITFRDKEAKGLTLRLNVRTGGAAYYLVAKIAGRTVRQKLHDTEDGTLAEARLKVHRLRYERGATSTLAPRKAEPEEQATEAPPPLVGDTVTALLAAHAAGKWLPRNRTKVPCPRTMENYEDLRRAQLEQHEKLTLAEYAERFPDLFEALKKSVPYQANRLLQLVRNLYAYAAAVEVWSGPNPAIGSGAKLLTRAPEHHRTRTLSDAEWRRLDAAMKAEGNRVWRDAFTASILSLQRMGAVCRMRWNDLHLTGKAAQWIIPREYMKGRVAAHRVPLSKLPELLAILKERRKIVPKPCEWVFPAVEGDGGSLRNYDKAWKRILERAKLYSEDKEKRPRPHDLRRTGGRRMTSAGVPNQTITKALGNSASSAGMVAKVYAHVADEAVDDAFAATAKRRRSRR
jgi:integrase